MAFKIPAFLFFFLFSTPLYSNPSKPLNLNWGKKPPPLLGRPELSNYRYIYGDSLWGRAVYGSKSDISGLNSELILYFASRKLSSALLILSDGLNENNCIAKYKEINSVLNKKYGHFLFQSQVKDPLIDDLIFSKKCHAIKAGLEITTTTWKLKNFRIESHLFGDEDQVFIEIEYYYLSLEKLENKENVKKTMNRL